VEQVIYGKEERKKKRRDRAEKPKSVVSINCGVNSKICTPTCGLKVPGPPFGRNPSVGFKNGKKTNYYYYDCCYYQ